MLVLRYRFSFGLRSLGVEELGTCTLSRATLNFLETIVLRSTSRSDLNRIILGGRIAIALRRRPIFGIEQYVRCYRMQMTTANKRSRADWI